MADKKPPSKAAIAKQTRQRYAGRQNTFSVAAQELPKPTTMVQKPEHTAESTSAVREAGRQRKSWTGTPEGQARTTEGVGSVRRMSTPGQATTAVQTKYGKAIVPKGPRKEAEVGEATTLSAVVGHGHAYGLGLRGQHVSQEGYRSSLEQTLGPAVPDLDEAHHVSDTVVPQRRWEDLHPHEKARTLAVAARHGVTMDSAKRDYGAQLDQAHNRAWSEGHSSTYSSLFYSGPSEPHDIISQSAGENAQHPNAQAPMKVSMRDVQAIANSITSPRNKFSVKKKGHADTLFPNNEHANTAIQHVLNNPHMSAEQAAATVPNNTGPSGGGIHGNIQRAAYAAHQLIYGGATPRTLMNPPAAKSGLRSRVFGTASTQKTTAYASAWMQPDSPDAFLTTDVHTGHGFAAHLGTAKEQLGLNAKGKPKLGKSDVEKYIEQTPNVHALHDYVARQVHAERGLSSGVNNTRFLHRGQAAQWGEERIQRPDITDATHKAAYGRPPAEMGQTRAAPHLTAAAEEPTWTMGDQKRHENTVAKRRRGQPRLAERTAGLDPNARSDGWM